MIPTINAEIIAIGTEILLGEITDTNSVFIARSLRDIGVNVYFMTSVGDNEQRIAEAIRIAMGRAQVVITCGGLGPTIDDMTRQSVAIATERELVFQQYLLDMIAARFATFRAQMTENNRRQAFLPDRATVIENPVGTAPSFIVEHRGSIVISLPGVPREMKFLMNESVIPYLRDHYNLGGGIIKARVLRTAGIGESLLDSEIGAEILEMSNPTVGLAAHSGQVDVRITAKAESEARANEMIDAVEAQIRGRVGRFIFGIDNDEIENVLVKLLHSNKSKIVVSETGLGNPLVNRLLNVTDGAAILAAQYEHSNPSEVMASLGMSTDLSIRELAEQLAEKICRNSNANAGIAIVSQPEIDDDRGDTADGTAVAVYTPTKQRSRVYGFGGKGEVVQSWTSTWALSMLWQMLIEQADV